MALNEVKQNNNFIFNIYEYLLCAYIVFTPIINSSKIYLFGYGIHIIITVLIVVFSLLVSMRDTEKPNMFFSNFILIVFLIEYLIGYFSGLNMIPGVILTFLSYIFFMKIPKSISVTKIFVSYYISAIISMIYTLITGNSGDSVSRTATSVDGSISVIGMIIVLFSDDSELKNPYYRILKFLAFISCVVIAAFGMSRSRLFIIAFLIMIKAVRVLAKLIKRGELKSSSVLLIPVFLIILIFVLNLEISQQLIVEITNRFDDGFKSLGRDDEIRFGWDLFLQKPFLGSGFEELRFVDYQKYNSPYSNHCMYIAILVRGGILLGIPFLLNFCSLFKSVIKSKSLICYIVLFTFMALGYGNAGLFNFTICGFMIPLIVLLRQENNFEYKIQGVNFKSENSIHF